MPVVGGKYHVAKLVTFSFEIVNIGGVRCDFNRNTLDDLEIVTFQCNHLAGVVGHQAKFSDPEVLEDQGSRSVVPQIRWEPERDVCLDGVHS